MPYITPERREAIQKGELPQNAGELNYLFSIISNDYIRRKSKSYQIFNDIIGALEGAKLELYRVVCSRYEDLKREVNGDVYTNEA